MKQQINLAKCLPKDRPQSLLTTQIIWIGVIFLISLFAYFGFSLRAEKQLQKNVTQLSTKNMKTSAQLQSFKKNHPDLVEGKLLEDQLSAFADNINAKKEILSVLSTRKNVLNIEGFSQYFSALANTPSPGTWLTNIDIKKGGKTIVLKGYTINQGQLLEYVNNINTDKAFMERTFRLEHLSQENAKNSRNGFTIISELEDTKQ
jgi:hypothetical protein